ncbi:hypothetical protein N658DRAFT_496891 [Parathielavia hyrcaniae]|uniref:Uncharacterized protein n=1 Tax=Parathielavia hyrcaniae TaxID=113614 RepID=A0AAN6PZG3_9PEZI|nr:hypothetical protein N658DRAFT_496891 [Parathielavia hyrcaniae]
MLVIRVLWLQVALVAAQLLDLNGTLGDGNRSSTPGVEEQVSPEAGSAGDAAAGSGGVLDPVLDAVIGPTGILDNNNAAAPTSEEAQNPPAATTEAESTVAESAAETPASAPTPEPTSEPSPEPSPATEQAPPAPTTNSPDNQQQEQPALVPVPLLPEAPGTPGPAPAPASSAAGEPAASSADSTVPSPSASSAQGTSFQEIIGPVPLPTTATLSPPAEGQPLASGDPILRIITASGSTFKSILVPATPTGAVGVIDRPNELGSDPSNSNTDPFQTSPEPNPAEDASNNNNNNAGTGGSDSAPNTTGEGTDTDTTTNNTNNNNPNPPSEIPLPTKIGIGVGLGAGSVVAVVLATILFWKRRMSRRRRGPPSATADSERGASPTPQDKAKMDVESEHDVAFDFGGFFRDRVQVPATVRRSPSQGSRGSQGSEGSRGGDGRYGDPLKAADDLGLSRPGAYGQVLQPPPQAAVELDGGAMPLYRGVIGVGR